MLVCLENFEAMSGMNCFESCENLERSLQESLTCDILQYSYKHA